MRRWRKVDSEAKCAAMEPRDLLAKWNLATRVDGMECLQVALAIAKLTPKTEPQKSDSEEEASAVGQLEGRLASWL